MPFFLLRPPGNSLLQVVVFILLSFCIPIFSRHMPVCPGVPLPEHWHGWHRAGVGLFWEREGSRSRVLRDAGAVGSECLCWDRSTGDGASGGHIRAREGKTGGLYLNVGVI